jgi:cyclopropane-fatty-acyl-phospholipid synthase
VSVLSADTAPSRRFDGIARALTDNWSAGRLTMSLPGKAPLKLAGAQAGPAATMTVHDYNFASRVLARGVTGFGEGFMAGEWDTPDLSALLIAFCRNLDRLNAAASGNAFMRWSMARLHALNANTRAGSRRNIEAHYDLGNPFYTLWLDETMSYSAARYHAGAADLASAQRDKYAALARMMDLKSGHHVLEIGCGWGGFAEYAAGEIGCRVTGLTLSPSQLAYARARIERAGLCDQVDLQLLDYRVATGSYDRIASIEMFEAVGEAWWPTYFQQVRALLKPGGKAGLQIISIREDLFENYRRRADFIQKYIFPGGMLPSPGRLDAEARRAGLVPTITETFSEDYARTLREWRERFEDASTAIRALGFDERFMRMWRFYLAYCEAGFTTGRTAVSQIVLSR